MNGHRHICTNGHCRKSWKCHHEKRVDCLRDDEFECLDCAKRDIDERIRNRAKPLRKQPRKEVYKEGVLFDYKKENLDHAA